MPQYKTSLSSCVRNLSLAMWNHIIALHTFVDESFECLRGVYKRGVIMLSFYGATAGLVLEALLSRISLFFVGSSTLIAAINLECKLLRKKTEKNSNTVNSCICPQFANKDLWFIFLSESIKAHLTTFNPANHPPTKSCMKGINKSC